MGNFIFHGVDVTELAREYGTPLYVVSEDEIIRRIDDVKGCFDERYEGCETYFASKAFLTKDMLRILMRYGLGLDVVSEGELFLAREMGFPPGKIAFHGNSKTTREIAAGLDYGVGKFVCDSLEEIALIDRMAKERGTAANVLIRVTPGVSGHTHRHISTGGADSKFGVPPAQIPEALALCSGASGVVLRGFHFHVGSQLMDNRTHMKALEILLELIARLRETVGFGTEILDMGGGYGIAYTKDDRPMPFCDFIRPMVELVECFCVERRIPRPDLVIEPGRYIAGPAGITLYTVGSVKEVPGATTYVGVDGGYPDNPRPALYDAVYEAVSGNRCDEPATRKTTVAGKCCESGDVLIRDIMLPEVRRGDILVVPVTGAYHHSMANNYNKNPIPAVVMIKDGEARLSVRRQTYEEMFASNL